MSTSAQLMSQLTRGGVATLVQVVFDNIEVGHYYYVREREPGELPYDLYGRVTEKVPEGVTLEMLYRRPIVDLNEGEWEAVDEDEETVYRATRDLINSNEQEMSARYYLPLEADAESDSD